MSKENTAINLAELSDEEIENLDPSTLEDETELPDDKDQETSENETDPSDTETDDTDGADAETDQEESSTQETDSTSEDKPDDAGNVSQTDDTEQQTTSADQAEDQDDATSEATDETTDTPDASAELAELLAPFKAGGRMIKIKTPDDLRILAQKGVDYSRKMADMKPYRQMLKTLEKEGLLDPEKMNFLIDLHKKDPAAMKKFFKDSGLDPHDLSYEDDTEAYSPNDNMVPEKEIALDAVLDEIRETPAFERTAKLITNQWDTASKRVLLDNPEVIKFLNDHITSGVFDQIEDTMATERALGRLEGLSDLEAYRKIGDAMHAAGKFEPNPNAPSKTDSATQDSAQEKGSDNTEVNRRKRAASPTKGGATSEKATPDFSKMSDDEIDKFDVTTLA